MTTHKRIPGFRKTFKARDTAMRIQSDDLLQVRDTCHGPRRHPVNTPYALSGFRPLPGFTLVELLVVITIIGILIALLLPGVQGAREASRRLQCLNNLKQIGLGLHNFHDANSRFPPGGAVDQPPFGTSTTGAAHGASWLVYLLPYVEQETLYQKFVFPGRSGWDNAHNADAYNNVALPVYRCPSSLLPVFHTMSIGTTGTHVCHPSYAGISGATEELNPAETRISVGGTATGCCSGGKVSGGGILFPNAKINISNITDGTTNTMIVGESSDFLYTLNGAQVAWSSGWHGFFIGCNNANTPPNYGNGGDARAMNQLSVRYLINQKRGWPNAPGNCGSTGVCDNIGTNTPLTSAHPGGIDIILADGSCRFVNENLDATTLGRLATRDDGLPLPGNY